MARGSGNTPFGGSTAVMGSGIDASISKSMSTTAPRPGLFIISDVRLYREGLVRSLSRQPTVTVIGAADTSPAAISEMSDHKPDVVILDVGGPGSFEFARSVNVNLPGVKIIAFAVSDVEHELLACAAAGFAGYVARDGSEADLIAAVENALRGELSVSPRMASLLFRQVATLSAQQLAPGEPSALTQRERQILALVGQGMSNKEIAREVRIGSATVKNHVHSILEKLQVRRRGEAAARFRMLQHTDSPRRYPATF
ncbi:two component transcriptional regulator, LuxR family [Rhizobiales bacterium GAS188]|nr:two component transcriptional regulator, LuxR family [Rhizobiales bacterium GAS188]